MAANLALLIGPSYASDLPDYCGPLEGVQNDLELMKGMLCRNGFLLENIKVCYEEIFKLDTQEDNRLRLVLATYPRKKSLCVNYSFLSNNIFLQGSEYQPCNFSHKFKVV